MKTRSLTILLLAIVAVLGGPGCGRDASVDNNSGRTSDTADFCVEHQIAESQCPFCNPDLIESLGHCHGHGVPEAFCYQCNADLIPAFKAVADWCAPHDRPESQCHICNPELDPAGQAPTPMHTTASALGPDDSPAAPETPENADSRMQQPPSANCTTEDLTVRFDSPEIAEAAGLQLATVELRSITNTVECNAEIAYDGNRYARLSAQVPGIVAEVRKDLGDRVQRGEALATIRSTHLGAAKAAYLQAVAAVSLWERNHAREANLLDRGVSTERDLFEAEARLAESRITLSEAEQVLLSLGLSMKQIEEVRRTDDTSALFVLVASFFGVVVDRDTVVGEVVDPSKPLFSIADVSRMWAILDILEPDLRHVRPGQPVLLTIESLPGQSFTGRITWVSSRLDPQTRTLQARADLDNTHGLLLAHMFAQASVTVREHRQSLVVPQASVQWEGCCNVVFVRKSETVYQPRKVHLGLTTGTVCEVLSGVREGEELVTEGSFLLKTEILKGNIGAGCCDIDPGA